MTTRRKNGKEHPLADKTLNLVWLKVPDTKTYEKVADQVERPTPHQHAVGQVRNGVVGRRRLPRRLSRPALGHGMAVRAGRSLATHGGGDRHGHQHQRARTAHRRWPILKVLGFGPWHIMLMVLGEALLIGAGSGFLSVAATYLIVNVWYGGVPFPIAFFPAFKIPALAFWWGPLIGGGTALVGSVVPAGHRHVRQGRPGVLQDLA